MHNALILQVWSMQPDASLIESAAKVTPITRYVWPGENKNHRGGE